MSRAMIASSATAGQPVRPSFEDISPSFICAFIVNLGSCACWAIIPSKVFTYSKARRINSGSKTHFPSSLKILTLAFELNIATISDNLSPSKPSVTAPIGKTSHNPVSSPRLNTCSTTPAVSATGKVFAIGEIAVYPPRTAAKLPVATVSESSRPGSRKCV